MSIILHKQPQRGQPELVYIDGYAGISYTDTVVNFELDYGSAFPSVPTGMITREYVPGEYHNLTNIDLNEITGEDVWTAGDDIISALPSLVAAQEARHTPPAPPPLTLAEEKVAAKRSIDNTAENARARYITSGSGQSMAYAEKSDQAADYVAAGYPADLTNYPFLQAEVNATGKTSTQAADDILSMKSAWIVIGAAVEEARLTGKIAVTAATDKAAVVVAEDAAVLALEAI